MMTSSKQHHHPTSENQKTTLQSMAHCKCPVCTQGDMFKSGPLNVAKFNELKESCEVCGFNFMPEPGFYQISLYFTYAVNVLIFLIAWILISLLFENPSMWTYLLAVAIPAIAIAPWNLRYSKVVMLYIFGDINRFKENLGY